MDDASAEPLVMPLDLLREITNDFSEERKLGSGSFGKVYKGVHQDGRKIAVKMLYDMPGLDDKEVQVKYEGKLVLAEKTHRALCLEYVSNGSLDKYLSDGCDRYDWHTGYGIINGICRGLKYLHSELKPPIYHLDLKPANILLDENMIPRIADFGMSRLFSDEQTRATRSSLGTFGYLPPEYIHNNLISNKFDIFSLGVVIIKIMAGRAGYFNSAEMPSQEFTDLVQKYWKNRLHETLNLREAYSEQIKICIEIGLGCVQDDRHQRPSIQDIVGRLNETVAKCTYAARKDLHLICQNSLGGITQPGKIYNPNYQQATPSRKDPSSSYNMETNRNIFPQYAQDPNDRHAKQIYHGSTFNQDIVAATHSKVNAAPREARLDDDSADVAKRWLHQEKGETKTSRMANKSSMPTKTNLKTKIPITSMPSKPGHKHPDSEMQNDINICISRGRADFDVFVLQWHSPGELWEHATLVLRRTGYQVNLRPENRVVIDEKYSPNVQTKIPNGRTTKFVLVSSGGVNLPFNTQGITEPNSEDNDIRLRDLIVLVMRGFQNKAPISPLVLPKEKDATSLAKEKDIYDIPSSSTTNSIAEPPALHSNKRWISSFFKRKGKA